MGNCCSTGGKEVSMTNIVAVPQVKQGYVPSRKVVPVVLMTNSPSIAVQRSSYVSEGREDQQSFGLSAPGLHHNNHSGSTIDWVAQVAETERAQQRIREGTAALGNRGAPLSTLTAEESATQPYHSNNKRTHGLRHLSVDVSEDGQQFSEGSGSRGNDSDELLGAESTMDGPFPVSPALGTIAPQGAHTVLPLTRGNLVALEKSTQFDGTTTAERITEGLVMRTEGAEEMSAGAPNAMQTFARHMMSSPGDQRPPTLPGFPIQRQNSLAETHVSVSVGSRRTVMSHSHVSSTATTGQVLAMLMADGSHGSQSTSVCSYVPLQMPRHLVKDGGL